MFLRSRPATTCPYCFRPLNLDGCPTVAQNFVGTVAGVTTTGGAVLDPPKLDADAVYSASAPTQSTVKESTNRPVSGAPSSGQIGPYPILFDPEANEGGGRSISGMFAQSRGFDPADRPAKICRECEMPLPENLASVDVFTIALVGTQFSGKTHYLTALGYELFRRQGFNALGLGRLRAGTSTSVEFQERRYLRVYEQRYAHERTTAAEGFVAARKPFAFELPPVNGRSTMVLIHDVPGEWLMDPNRRAGHFQFLNHANGAIFLIDPLSLPSVRRRLADTVDSAHLAGSRWNQDLLIDELAAQLGPRAHSLPTSVVISKGDMVERIFGPIPEFASEDPRSVAELDQNIAVMHRVVRDRILPWLDEPAIAAAAADRFPKTVYHMVSQLGVLPEFTTDAGGNPVQRIVGEIRSRRVLSPFYSILTDR